MRLSGLDLLLTFQCNLECDHCFVWGSPWQTGTMTRAAVREVLRQAAELGSIERIYFEGGEPFLFYGVLLPAVREACRRGFRVGVVSNGYWATSPDDAREWLSPPAGLVDNILGRSGPRPPSRRAPTRTCGNRGACTWTRWATCSSARASPLATSSGRRCARSARRN